MLRLLRRLRYVLMQRRFERELANEIAHHRAMLDADGRGRRLGNVTLALEDARVVWIPSSFDSVRRDTAYACRALWRQRGFTVVAVGALAAGIGLNTAIFSIFNALAIRSWPVRDAERVVTVFKLSPRDLRVRGGGAPRGFSLAEIDYLSTNAKMAAGFLATRSGGGDHTLGEDDTPVQWVSGNYFSLPEESNMVYEVSPAFFRVLGIPIVAGRGLLPEDNGTGWVVVSEALARQFWTVDDAVGKRLVVDADAGGWNRPGELEIVGVARDAGLTSLTDSGPMIYQTLSGRSVPHVLVPATGRGAAEAAVAAAQRIEPRLRPAQRPLIDNLAPHVRASRVAAAAAAGLGGLALVLAAIGMFGVFAYWVQQRTREIGIRMALGARAPQVVAVVLRSSGWSIGLGAITGIAAALMTSRLLRSYLFGLSPLDPVAYAGVVFLLAAAGTLATYVPVRRATRVDPVGALRCE